MAMPAIGDTMTFAQPSLSRQSLHVWRVDLDRALAEIGAPAECLSAEECCRAGRLVREEDRRRFIVGHTALRTILGGYLDVPPRRVETVVRAGGKPELAPRSTATRLQFNLSHSRSLAMVALTLDREVGVDVEFVRAFDNMENLVRRYFAPGEQAAWQNLPQSERLTAFFRCWTRKEAYLKARGIGLSAGLDQFEVSLAPGEAARLLSVRDTRDSHMQWQVYDVPAGDGHMAACVVQRDVKEMAIYDWPMSMSSTKLSSLEAEEESSQWRA